jgi:hypothetical protein
MPDIPARYREISRSLRYSLLDFGASSSQEGWLEAIKQEIENNLIASMGSNRPELSALH